MDKFYKTKDNSMVFFEWTVLKNNFESNKQERPIFDKVLRAKIISVGQQKSHVSYDVIRIDQNGQNHYSASYQKFKEFVEDFIKDGDGGKLQGTPIGEWGEISMQRVAELKALNIFTVEALIDIPDSALGNIGMDARKLQKAAKDFVRSKSETVTELNDLRAENEDLKTRLIRLESLYSQGEGDMVPETSIDKPKTRKKG